MKNLREISKEVANNNNLPKKLVHQILVDTFDVMANTLIKEKQEIRIKNFGTFEFGRVPGKKTKHPTTREEIIIPDKNTVRLGLSTRIKKGLNN